MGFIAFVMLVAPDFAQVIRAREGVEELVNNAAAIMSGSKLIAANIMLMIGLLITMGIGTPLERFPLLLQFSFLWGLRWDLALWLSLL